MKIRSALFRTLLGAFLIGGSAVASATNVTFNQGGYVLGTTSVTLSMSNITNNSSNNSGTLRMELWALDAPWSGVPGSVQKGYRISVSPMFGPLDANSYFTQSPLQETSTYAPPANGTYYMTLFLAEYQAGAYDDGYESVAYANFVNQQTFDNGGSSFGISSAVPVGYGYYYDSDLQYIYSFGDGWIYLSDLSRYFYVEPGTDFTTGVYIYDLSRSSWTYTEKSFWPYVYYFDGTGWVDTGFN